MEYIEASSTIQIFTEGSKSEHVVGADAVIFKSGDHIASLKERLTNLHLQSNQAAGNNKSNKVFRKQVDRRQHCQHIQRLSNDTGIA